MLSLSKHDATHERRGRVCFDKLSMTLILAWVRGHTSNCARVSSPLIPQPLLRKGEGESLITTIRR